MKEPEYKIRDKFLVRFNTEKGQKVFAEWVFELQKDRGTAGINSKLEEKMIEFMSNDLQNKRATNSLIAQQIESSSNEIVNRVSSILELKTKDLLYEILMETVPLNKKTNLLINILKDNFKLTEQEISDPSPEKINVKPKFEQEVRDIIKTKKRQK